jgi:hypothetical protein
VSSSAVASVKAHLISHNEIPGPQLGIEPGRHPDREGDRAGDLIEEAASGGFGMLSPHSGRYQDHLSVL